MSSAKIETLQRFLWHQFNFRLPSNIENTFVSASCTNTQTLLIHLIPFVFVAAFQFCVGQNHNDSGTHNTHKS